MSWRPALAAAALTAVLASTACSGYRGGGSPMSAATSATAPTWVVSLGDSYISGEGDRWAGNTDGSFVKVDALGPFAYAGPHGPEDISGCQRADLPEVALQAGGQAGNVLGKNLACPGAETASRSEGVTFEPGIDFYDDGNRLGQALALERFAKGHQVSAVVVSIGGNDFNFSTILTRCVADFFTTVWLQPRYCSNDASLATYFTTAYAADVEQRIGAALDNVTLAMDRAGRKPADYRVIVQGYPSPVPPGSGFRYPETSAGRLALGGCPIFDKDASWANSTVLATINTTVRRAVDASGQDNITYLDMTGAFAGHRLCERGAAQLQESGLGSWRSAGAANALEWVNAVYLKGSPWRVQESAHPNYWGTAAERSCLRQVVAQPRPSSVACVRDGTAMAGHEPAMKLIGDRPAR